MPGSVHAQDNSEVHSTHLLIALTPVASSFGCCLRRHAQINGGIRCWQSLVWCLQHLSSSQTTSALTVSICAPLYRGCSIVPC